jgi:hypothetical protein
MNDMLMGWGNFEQKAANTIPDQPLKVKRFWVGFFRHDQDPDQPELDFIWMLRHGVGLLLIPLLTLILNNLNISLT